MSAAQKLLDKKPKFQKIDLLKIANKDNRKLVSDKLKVAKDKAGSAVSTVRTHGSKAKRYISSKYDASGINQSIDRLSKTKTGKGLRVRGTQLKNLLINPKAKNVFGKLKVGSKLGPAFATLMAHGDYKEMRDKYISQGYSKNEARIKSLIEVGSGVAGGALAAGTVTVGSGLTAGVAAVPIYMGGHWAGSKLGKGITNLVGLNKSKEVLNERLAKQQVLNNRLEHAKIQAGGAN